MAETLFGILLLLGTVVAAIDGLNAIAHGETAMDQIYGALNLVLAGVLFVGVVICSIASRIAAIQKTIADGAKNRELAEKSREGVALERWEILCASLDRLERGDRRGEEGDFDPTIERPAPALKAKCSECGRTIKAKPDWAGRAAKCPSCGAAIQFPAIASL